jgi:hypothetical protein
VTRLPPDSPEPDVDAALAADLAALADGSLDAAVRAEVQERVGSSPEIDTLLDEQRRALSLLASAGDVQAPEALHARVEELASRRRWSAWGAPARKEGSAPAPRQGRRAGVAAAVLATVAAALAIGLVVGSGGSSGPTLGEYAALGSLPATAGAPHKLPGARSLLAAHVEGVPFPYWEDRFGWRASGVRSDKLDGRAVTTVFYGGHDGSHVAYSIVAGTPPPLSGGSGAARGGAAVWRGGVRYWIQNVDGRSTIVWLRNGRRCIISGYDLSPRALLALASWNGENHVAA